MVNNFGGGNRLIRGQLVIDTSSLEEARQVTLRSMKAVRESFEQVRSSVQTAGKNTEQAATGIQSATKRIADGFRQAEQSAKAFAKTDLGTISSGLNKIANDFAKISLASGVFVGKALQSADAIKALEIRFTALTGSQKAARDLMGQIENQATRLGQPIRAAQEAAAGLLPSLKGNTKQLETYLNLSARLAVLNRGEGLAGASFAIREALSSGGTDLVSLAERFNINRAELRNEIARASASGADRTTAFATALDKILNKLGATNAAATDLATTFGSQFRGLLDALDTAFGEAFQGVAADLGMIVKNFKDFVTNLRETNPELLKTVSIGALMLAAFSPVAKVFAAMVGSIGLLKSGLTGTVALIKEIPKLNALPVIKQLNELDAKGGVGKVATRAGVGLAALDIGLEGGRFAVKTLAGLGVQGGDFDRVRKGEDPLAIAGERLKQVFVIVINTFLDFTQTLSKIFTVIGNVFARFVDILTIGGGVISSAFASIQKVIGDLLIGLADTFSGLFDTTNLRNTGFDVRDSALARQADIDKERTDALNRLSQGIGLTPEQEQNIAANADAIKQQVLGTLVDNLFPPPSDIDRFKALLESGGQSLTDSFNALATSIKDGILSIEIQTVPTEIITAFGKFQEEMLALDQEYVQKRLDLLKSQAAELKAVDTSAADKVQGVRDDATNRDLEREIKRQQELGDLTDKFNQQQADAERKYEEEEARARRSHRLSLFQAALSLDGRAILEENKRYKNEQKTREDAFKDQQTQIERERQAAIDALTVQLQREAEAQSRADEIKLKEIEASRIQELAQLRVKHAEQLTDLQTQLDNEKAAKNQAFVDLYNEMAKEAGLHNERMLDTQKQGLDDMRVAFENWFADQKALIEQSASQTPQPAATPTSPRLPGFLPGFATGSIGLPRDMAIQAHEGEIIFNKGISNTLRALVRGGGQPVTQSNLALALAGGGTFSAGDVRNTTNNNNMNLNIANPPNMSEGAFEALLVRVLNKINR